MKLYLRAPTRADEAEITAMRREFLEADNRVYPGTLRRFDGDYGAYLERLKLMADESTVPKGLVPSNTYVLSDDNGRLYGACEIRRRLNDDLLNVGGNIGYAVRPCERNKGAGTAQLLLALERMRDMGFKRALITCNLSNTASANVIENNAGALENVITEAGGNMVKRYWVALDTPPVAIMRARPGDETRIRELQEQIANLHHEGRPDLFKREARYFTPESFKKRLDDPDHAIWIASDARGKAVGYAFSNIVRYRNHSTYIDFDSYYVDDICVLDTHKRQGIGRRLFEKCVRRARALNCHNVELGVWGFNAGAIAFYESMGMRERVRRMELRLDADTIMARTKV